LDPGSGKNSSRIRISDPGGKKAPDPGSGSATLHFLLIKKLAPETTGIISNKKVGFIFHPYFYVQ
jgi:hypothetical protein